jgi:hypothetical protein
MPLTASDSGGADFAIVPAGVFQGVCQSVIDLGTQYNKTYDNYSHKVMITWELPTERIQLEKDGVEIDKPMVISRRFTLSLHSKSAFRPFLESWRGTGFNAQDLMGFDISKLVGVNCMLNIVHATVGEKTYANIATAMPLLKNMPRLKPENPVLYYSMEDHGLSIPEEIHDWQKKIIMESKEYNEQGQQGQEYGDTGTYPESEDLGDVPF